MGRIDVLMNMAAVIKPGAVQDTTANEVDFHIDVNVKGTMYGTQIAATQMIKEGSGHIINFASLTGRRPDSRQHALFGLQICGAGLFAGGGRRFKTVPPGGETVITYTVLYTRPPQ